MKSYYIIDSINEQFRTLADAKNHLSFDTPNDIKRLYRVCEGNIYISKVVGAKIAATVEVKVNTDNWSYSFGKSIKQA